MAKKAATKAPQTEEVATYDNKYWHVVKAKATGQVTEVGAQVAAIIVRTEHYDYVGQGRKIGGEQ